MVLSATKWWDGFVSMIFHLKALLLLFSEISAQIPNISACARWNAKENHVSNNSFSNNRKINSIYIILYFFQMLLIWMQTFIKKILTRNINPSTRNFQINLINEQGCRTRSTNTIFSSENARCWKNTNNYFQHGHLYDGIICACRRKPGSW